MEEVDKEAKDQKTTLQDLLFEGSSTGVGPDISSSEQQKKNAWTNQQEQQAPQDVAYDNRTAQQQQNQYEVGKATQVLILLLQV